MYTECFEGRRHHPSIAAARPARPAVEAPRQSPVMKHFAAVGLLLAACTKSPETAAFAPVTASADSAASVLASAVPASTMRAPVAAASISAAIIASTDRLAPKLIALRRDLHKHPELSGKEERTAQRIADELRVLDLEVRTGVGGHGVVAVLRGARPGPVVAYRADMDASPGDEPAGREYGSRVPGVFHLCGHDLHSAIGVGVASVLASQRHQLPGTALFLFQPAEETLAGARAMLADGALGEFAPTAIFALHTGPMPVGTFGLNLDYAGQDRFEVTLAAPTRGLETTIARLKALGTVSPPGGPADASSDASKRAVYAVIEADTNGPRPRIRGWLRTGRDEDYPSLRSEVRSILDAELPAGTFELSFVDAPFPSMRNDRQATERAKPALVEVAGAVNVIPIDQTWMFNGEDFALWRQRAPGSMFVLGVANAERGIGGAPHSPDYDADEGAIALATKAMSLVLWRELAAPPRP